MRVKERKTEIQQDVVFRPVIPALRSMTQGDWEFRARLAYIVKPSLKR